MSLKAFDVRLPEAYRSTDFKVFEGLGKIALGICKEDINNLSYLNSIDILTELDNINITYYHIYVKK